MVKNPKLLKSKPPNVYISELTVFIIVKIPILKDVAKSILEIVNKIVIKNKEITKITIDKKHLLISEISVLVSINVTLLE